MMMHDGTRDRIFRSLAHPVRRSLLVALREEGSQPVQGLAARFDMSQPALSQHLGILREAGLVEYRRDGRQHLYRLSPDALLEAAEWLHPFARFWRDRLSILGEHLNSESDSESARPGDRGEERRPSDPEEDP